MTKVVVVVRPLLRSAVTLFLAPLSLSLSLSLSFSQSFVTSEEAVFYFLAARMRTNAAPLDETGSLLVPWEFNDFSP